MNDLKEYKMTLELQAKALYGKRDKALELMEEVLLASKFDDTKRLFEPLDCPCFLCGAPSAQSAAPSISEVLALLFADNFTFEHGVEEWFCWLQFHELHSMLS